MHITLPATAQQLRNSEPTFCRWKKVYAGMGVTEIRRLKQLEDENAKLKRVVADLTLDKAMLQDVLRKKWRGPLSDARSCTICKRSTILASGGPAKRPAFIAPPSATSRGAIRKPSCAFG